MPTASSHQLAKFCQAIHPNGFISFPEAGQDATLANLLARSSAKSLLAARSIYSIKNHRRQRYQVAVNDLQRQHGDLTAWRGPSERLKHL